MSLNFIAWRIKRYKVIIRRYPNFKFEALSYAVRMSFM